MSLLECRYSGGGKMGLSKLRLSFKESSMESGEELRNRRLQDGGDLSSSPFTYGWLTSDVSLLFKQKGPC